MIAVCGEFQTMSVLALSPVGLMSGALVGIVTVLLAAQSPAKRAAKVSPMAAVSGSSDTQLIAVPKSNPTGTAVLHQFNASRRT